jgi:hypothetical protein
MALEFPGSVTVVPPAVPTLVMAPPIAGADVLVLPVAGAQGPIGPLGPIGPQGPQGVPGDAGAALAFVQTVSSPSLNVQVNHGLPFRPSGIVCLETDGTPTPLGIGVSYPSLGQVQLIFGVPFTGTIYLS